LAVTFRAAPRRGHLQYVFIAAALAAAAVAVLPIAFAIFADGAPLATSHTAFASAPAGDYAVVARTEGDTDVITVARADNAELSMEITRVRHVDGYSAAGAVSPDGKLLALALPDSGTPTQPLASLVVVDLGSGAQQKLTGDVDALAAPVWAPDGASLVITRTSVSLNGEANVAFLRVPVAGGAATTAFTVRAVLGAYGVGFDRQDRFIAVEIDGRGSTALRDGAELSLLSTQITRDWRLSPDGSQIAFIESNLDGGIHYEARTAVLDGSRPDASNGAQVDGSQQLGVAWQPGAPAATFGGEHPIQSSARFEAQAAAADGVTGGAGFDVPLGYSNDGTALAVDHWTGSSFAQAGTSTLQVMSDAGARTTLNGFARFFGWSTR
jgi:hypothetical protein